MEKTLWRKRFHFNDESSLNLSPNDYRKNVLLSLSKSNCKKDEKRMCFKNVPWNFNNFFLKQIYFFSNSLRFFLKCIYKNEFFKASVFFVNDLRTLKEKEMKLNWKYQYNNCNFQFYARMKFFGRIHCQQFDDRYLQNL